MNAVERRDRLIKILLLRGRTTVKDLAELLEVSERTVMRDISILSNIKPISAISGKGGGVYILDTFEVQRTYMNEYEISVLRKLIENKDKSINTVLSETEVQMLDEIITYYSKPEYKRGKKT